MLDGRRETDAYGGEIGLRASDLLERFPCDLDKVIENPAWVVADLKLLVHFSECGTDEVGGRDSGVRGADVRGNDDTCVRIERDARRAPPPSEAENDYFDDPATLFKAAASQGKT